MGLILTAINSLTGTLNDNWKDYFVCDSLDSNTLIVKGTKKGKGLFGDPDVITNGSGIVVADGQCAIVVEEGRVVEVAGEPGNYTFDTSLSPTVFAGWQGIKDTFKEMLERFTYEGVANKTQRVYYVNTKEIMGNLFGTANAIPFRLIDKNIGLDIDTAVRCNGEYSFAIVNPILFYKNVAGNSADRYTKEDLVAQMKVEVVNALQPALAKISALGVRYSEIPAHNTELADLINEQLSAKWEELRGIKVVSVNLNPITISPEDEKMIKDLQKAATLKDPAMLAANLAAAQADAIRDAANNTNGVAAAMMGVNMVGGSGTSDTITAALNAANKSDTKYCMSCGKQIPADAAFCPYCGKAQ